MHLRIDDERSLRPSELKDVRDEAARLPACAADPTAEAQSHLAQSHLAQSHSAQSHLGLSSTQAVSCSALRSGPQQPGPAP